ncbi:hypothetical protein [Amycolatopsis stemonae]
MSKIELSPAERRHRAEQDVAAPGRHREGELLLRVRCSAGHPVAEVYATARGSVFVSPADARQGDEYVGTIAGDGDDLVPAWCACGGRRISRSALPRSISLHEKTVLVR